MLKDGLFDRFPCDEIYALHNDPNGSPERLSVKPGPAMAGADSFDVHIRGAGAHGAMPDRARDPVVAAIFLAAQLQTIVSRNIPASEPAVLSVTQIHSGTAYNVIPSTARLSGTIRYFSDEIGTKIGQRVRTLADGIATAYELEVDVEIRNTFNVLINDAALTHELVAAAQEIVGSENASLTSRVRTGSDDFAEFLRVVPGAYASLGHASSIPLHNERFLLDENILPVGASIFARLVERRATA
jgi:amidohydrolase